MPGVYIPAGDIEMVLDGHKMGHFFRFMLGNYSCLGSTKNGAAVTLDRASSTGDTEVTVSAVDSISVGDLVQFGDDWAGTTEVHEISEIDTTNQQVVLSEELLNDHADGISIQSVSAPFAHQFTPTSLSNTLPSLEIRVVRDAVGGDHRFLGATVNSATFSLEVNDVMKVTLGIIAQKDELVSHWAAGAGALAMSGFGFDEVEHIRFDPDGADAAVDVTPYARSLSISYSNGIQSEMGVRFGSRFPRELPVGSVEATLQATLVFKSTQAH